MEHRIDGDGERWKEKQMRGIILPRRTSRALGLMYGCGGRARGGGNKLDRGKEGKRRRRKKMMMMKQKDEEQMKK